MESVEGENNFKKKEQTTVKVVNNVKVYNVVTLQSDLKTVER